MKFACLLSYLLVNLVCGSAQQLQQVPHCPSNEVYDMLLDKKGFIWIAHNLGVSRYDGISFTSFTNPEETSISMTDLVEDNYGRIWCHNFNGQIFYIKDDKMFYLKEYDFKKETLFPRMVLHGDELVVTSRWGLFVCNTLSLKCDYIRFKNFEKRDHIGVGNLCIVGNRVLVQDAYYAWYTYQSGRGLSPIQSRGLNFTPPLPYILKLEPRTFNDTAFLMNNPQGDLYGLAIVRDTLAPVFVKHIKANINTVSIINNEIWVNTGLASFSLYGRDTISNYDLTAMIVDREGNKWFTSLTYGLLVSYKSSGWKNMHHVFLPTNDFPRVIKKTDNGFIVCTQFGHVMVAKALTDSLKTCYTVSPKHGKPVNIQPVYNNVYFIETSIALFTLDVSTGKMTIIDSIVSSKDITLRGQVAYLAGSLSMMVKDIRDWGLMGADNRGKPFIINESLLEKTPTMNIMKIKGFRIWHRCRAVMFDTATNSLFASFTDGLRRIKDSRIGYVLYNGQPLYVSSMARYDNKIFAGTFNSGLFVIEGYDVKKVNNGIESPQNAIIRLKCCNNHIWVFRSDDIQVLDAATDKFIDLYPFPVDVADITDAEEDSNTIYLTTYSGLYTIPALQKVETVKANPSLLYMLVNNTDTVFQGNISLPANKNNLLFRLAIPVYKNAEQLHFKYRLVGDNDTTASGVWYYTQDAQRDIQFNALKPGNYTIEITAVKDNRLISNKRLIYHFSINKPWYSTWWFYSAVLLFTVSVSIALYQYRLRQLVKMEKMRRKISNDLHDDIGSTLSSINIYSQLAKGDSANLAYIDTIQNNAVNIINSLDELVWNINPKNDLLGQLMSRMQLYASSLLGEKGIAFVFKAKITDKNLIVSPNVRAHIYLLFKEIINNIIKHAGCTQCVVYLIQKNNRLRLTVKDNGRGFNTKNTSQHRNGLRIMAERVKELKGTIDIKSAPGEGSEIKIGCYVK